MRGQLKRKQKRLFDSWKEHNGRVFSREQTPILILLQRNVDEFVLWHMAGAHFMEAYQAESSPFNLVGSPFFYLVFWFVVLLFASSHCSLLSAPLLVHFHLSCFGFASCICVCFYLMEWYAMLLGVIKKIRYQMVCHTLPVWFVTKVNQTKFW